MADEDRNQPQGPERLPREQPRPDVNDLTASRSLPQGSTSRWVVPAGVLAGVVISLALWALSINVVVPFFAIVWVVVIWIVMYLASKRETDAKSGNRRLAWLMGLMAIGSVVAFVVLYIVEGTGIAG